jgi:uncharacterized protein (DUF58 family)
MRLSTSGIVFTALGIACIIAAYRFGLPGLLPLGILLLGLVVCSGLGVWLLAGRVTAEAELVGSASSPPVVRAGSTAHIRVHVHNPLPLPAPAFVLALEPVKGFGAQLSAGVPGLAGRGWAAVDAEFHPLHRGASGLRRISTVFSGAFGLVTRSARLAGPFEVAVAPADLAVHAPATFGSDPAVSHGARLTRGTGGRDFHTREYVPGDDLRHVHWTSSARTGELMVRVEAREEDPLLTAAFDLSYADPATEAVLAQFAALGRTLLNTGVAVTAVATDSDGTIHEFAPGEEAAFDRFLALWEPRGLEDWPAELCGGAGRPAPERILVLSDSPTAHDHFAQWLPRQTSCQVWSTADLTGHIDATRLGEVDAPVLPWHLDRRWGR